MGKEDFEINNNSLVKKYKDIVRKSFNVEIDDTFDYRSSKQLNHKSSFEMLKIFGKLIEEHNKTQKDSPAYEDEKNFIKLFRGNLMFYGVHNAIIDEYLENPVDISFENFERKLISYDVLGKKVVDRVKRINQYQDYIQTHIAELKSQKVTNPIAQTYLDDDTFNPGFLREFTTDGSASIVNLNVSPMVLVDALTEKYLSGEMHSADVSYSTKFKSFIQSFDFAQKDRRIKASNYAFFLGRLATEREFIKKQVERHIAMVAQIELEPYGRDKWSLEEFYEGKKICGLEITALKEIKDAEKLEKIEDEFEASMPSIEEREFTTMHMRTNDINGSFFHGEDDFIDVENSLRDIEFEPDDELDMEAVIGNGAEKIEKSDFAEERNKDEIIGDDEEKIIGEDENNIDNPLNKKEPIIVAVDTDLKKEMESDQKLIDEIGSYKVDDMRSILDNEILSVGDLTGGEIDVGEAYPTLLDTSLLEFKNTPNSGLMQKVRNVFGINDSRIDQDDIQAASAFNELLKTNPAKLTIGLGRNNASYNAMCYGDYLTPSSMVSALALYKTVYERYNSRGFFSTIVGYVLGTSSEERAALKRMEDAFKSNGIKKEQLVGMIESEKTIINNVQALEKAGKFKTPADRVEYFDLLHNLAEYTAPLYVKKGDVYQEQHGYPIMKADEKYGENLSIPVLPLTKFTSIPEVDVPNSKDLYAKYYRITYGDEGYSEEKFNKYLRAYVAAVRHLNNTPDNSDRQHFQKVFSKSLEALSKMAGSIKKGVPSLELFVQEGTDNLCEEKGIDFYEDYTSKMIIDPTQTNIFDLETITKKIEDFDKIPSVVSEGKKPMDLPGDLFDLDTQFNIDYNVQMAKSPENIIPSNENDISYEASEDEDELDFSDEMNLLK